MFVSNHQFQNNGHQNFLKNKNTTYLQLPSAVESYKRNSFFSPLNCTLTRSKMKSQG